ncbi:hypothetical protein AVEN_75239-1 [Araneus ventricosus]|uniref:Secreted protein n=1 Tax=Araneus ventricosus TaxID=182803 RepID=A0A4Y2P6Z0_ARAVE|nr:hypothetical protein AVEN_75239-1 [Araneus ventricosus]
MRRFRVNRHLRHHVMAAQLIIGVIQTACHGVQSSSQSSRSSHFISQRRSLVITHDIVIIISQRYVFPPTNISAPSYRSRAILPLIGVSNLQFVRGILRRGQKPVTHVF